MSPNKPANFKSGDRVSIISRRSHNRSELIAFQAMIDEAFPGLTGWLYSLRHLKGFSDMNGSTPLSIPFLDREVLVQEHELVAPLPGYRFLEFGEIVMDGDLCTQADGILPWIKRTSGFGRKYNNTIWPTIRKIEQDA